MVVDPIIFRDRALGAPKHPVPSGDGGISHATVAWRGMALPSGQGWQHHWPSTACPEGAQPQQQLRSP